MTKNKKKSIKEIDEQQSDELMEIHFKKLMQETKNERHKSGMKYFSEKLNPDDFVPIRDFARTLRRLILYFYIEICELEKERDEAQLKLKEYQETSKSKRGFQKKTHGKDLIVDVRG